MATATRAIRGHAFVTACLWRIENRIKLLMFDIEEGLEVNIPTDLSQSTLPHSFRYYDPVIAIIKENISDKAIDLF